MAARGATGEREGGTTIGSLLAPLTAAGLSAALAGAGLAVLPLALDPPGGGLEWTPRSAAAAAGMVVVVAAAGASWLWLTRAACRLLAMADQARRSDQAKSRFLAAASHDLRQPLQAMRLFVEVLANLLDQARQREVLAKLREAQSSAEQLLNVLLDVSTLETGIVRPRTAEARAGDILRGLADEAAALAESKGIGLTWVDSRALVRTDPVLLRRMLRNLAVNAVRHTKSGRVLIGCRRRRGHLRFEVWDNGPGIPADQLEAIFEEFYRIGPGSAGGEFECGLGLGLAVVRRMSALLAHPVTVRSWPGRGSVFAVDVPLAPSPAPRRRAAELEQPLGGLS